MDLSFSNIDISDKGWIDTLLSYNDYRSSEYCFTSIFIWSNTYNLQISRIEDWLIVRSIDDKDSVFYFFPAGRGDLKKAIQSILDDAESLGRRAVITTISPKNKTLLESIFPNTFSFTLKRDTFDYIYDRESLANLTGKKYQPKRNHIARFKELPNWSYEVIDSRDPVRFDKQIDDCIEMTKKWCIKNGCKDNISMIFENCFTQRALTNFANLGLKGGLLRVDNEVVAYTLGEGINSDTFIVHIEKAFSEINGSYPMINQSFIQREANEYKFVNREDDTGDEGLRRAKLSYNPVFFEEKYYGTKI